MSNALQKKKCKQELEQSLATIPSSNVYRHLNNQVLNNLEQSLAVGMKRTYLC